MSNHIQIHDDEYRATFAVPVTLREIEAERVTIHGITGFSHVIPLDSNFGIDEAEHAEMLDDPDILRVTFGVEWNRETNSVSEVYGLEAYSASLRHGPQWDDCINLRALDHAAGSVQRGNWLSVKSALETLAQRHADVYAILAEARKPFDEMVAELSAEADAESE